MALNLTKPKQRDEQQQPQRTDFNFAIPKPSTVVPKEVIYMEYPSLEFFNFTKLILQNELKRTHTAPLMELNTQPMARQPNFGVSLLKRPLQQQQAPQDQPMELTAKPPKQVMRLVGFGSGGNSASRANETSSSANRTYIAISRPVPTAASAAAGAVSISKVPHGLYRAATL